MGDQLQQAITKHSRISIALAFTLMGVVFWLGVAWADLVQIKSRIGSLESIDTRLARIEGKLGINPQEQGGSHQ